jgi:uncharacterized tellurite resistance protein B-like protein
MHILLAIIAALGAVGVVLWRLDAAAKSAKGVIDSANEAHGLIRRWGWQRKLANNPLDLVQDSREAAAAMMVAVAQSDGAMTDRERAAIETELMTRIGATEPQAKELLVRGRWFTRDVRDLDQCLAKLVPLIRSQCSPDQIHDVLEMLNRVANAEGQPGQIESSALARTARALRTE